MGLAFKYPPPAPAYDSRNRRVSEPWEPPAPLNWFDRHPHLATALVSLVTIAVAAIILQLT